MWLQACVYNVTPGKVQYRMADMPRLLKTPITNSKVTQSSAERGVWPWIEKTENEGVLKGVQILGGSVLKGVQILGGRCLERGSGVLLERWSRSTARAIKGNWLPQVIVHSFLLFDQFHNGVFESLTFPYLPSRQFALLFLCGWCAISSIFAL